MQILNSNKLNFNKNGIYFCEHTKDSGLHQCHVLARFNTHKHSLVSIFLFLFLWNKVFFFSYWSTVSFILWIILGGLLSNPCLLKTFINNKMWPFSFIQNNILFHTNGLYMMYKVSTTVQEVVHSIVCQLSHIILHFSLTGDKQMMSQNGKTSQISVLHFVPTQMQTNLYKPHETTHLKQ